MTELRWLIITYPHNLKDEPILQYKDPEYNMWFNVETTHKNEDEDPTED